MRGIDLTYRKDSKTIPLKLIDFKFWSIFRHDMRVVRGALRSKKTKGHKPLVCIMNPDHPYEIRHVMCVAARVAKPSDLFSCVFDKHALVADKNDPTKPMSFSTYTRNPHK